MGQKFAFLVCELLAHEMIAETIDPVMATSIKKSPNTNVLPYKLLTTQLFYPFTSQHSYHIFSR